MEDEVFRGLLGDGVGDGEGDSDVAIGKGFPPAATTRSCSIVSSEESSGAEEAWEASSCKRLSTECASCTTSEGASTGSSEYSSENLSGKL